ncbi:hypothetical protein INT43_006435 [Umbelopsis isabellina]|uniref:Uncharacterized protein n=1 Tax=Mortierella isabellina TaxID=91625 RepID=A0A8H7ULQ7_MORIS|nr:hypothetical protein INT43_006435 [Umbelopsis isabellina]
MGPRKQMASSITDLNTLALSWKQELDLRGPCGRGATGRPPPSKLPCYGWPNSAWMGWASSVPEGPGNYSTPFYERLAEGSRFHCKKTVW